MTGRLEGGHRLLQLMLRHQYPVGVMGGDGKDGNVGIGQGLREGRQDADQLVVEGTLYAQGRPPATMSHPRWDQRLLADDRKFAGGAADAPPLPGNRPSGNRFARRQTTHHQRRPAGFHPLTPRLATTTALHGQESRAGGVALAGIPARDRSGDAFDTLAPPLAWSGHMGPWRSGSALPWHGRGRGFDSRRLHQSSPTCYATLRVGDPDDSEGRLVSDPIFEDKRLAALYDPLDPDRNDLDASLSFATRRRTPKTRAARGMVAQP